MPEVVFYALGGRSIEQKRALIKEAKGGVLFSDMGAAKT